MDTFEIETTPALKVAGRRQTYALLIGVAGGLLVAGLLVPLAVGDEPTTNTGGGAAVVAGAAPTGSHSPVPTDAAAPVVEDTSVLGSRGASPSARAAPGTPAGRTATPEAGSAPTLTASDVGVTPTSIKVGVLIADLGGAAALGFTFDTGDIEDQYRRFFDELNARGGLGGRKAELAVQRFDPVQGDSMQAACLALAEDKKVFAALNSGGYFGAPVLCLTRDHHVPLVTAIDSSPEEYYAQADGFLFSDLMQKHRILRVLAGELDRLGLLRGKDIGVLSSEHPADKTPVDTGLLPALQALGYKVAYRTTLSQDPSTAAGQMPVEVGRMRAAGVDAVLVAVNLVYATLFAQEADAQQFRPAYYGSDFSQISTDFALTQMPASFYNNNLATTSIRTGEHRTGAPEAATDAACRALYEKASGRTVTRGGGEYTSALGVCGLVRDFEAGVGAAGPQLTRAAFSTGLRQRRDYPMPFFGGTGSLGPAKFDGADYVRTLRASPDCKCWLPVDDFRRARF